MNFLELFLNELSVPVKGVSSVYSLFFFPFSLLASTRDAYLITKDNLVDEKFLPLYPRL